jgi:protein-S-isoprenylcysteine O-methyltransferase Ste14
MTTTKVPLGARSAVFAYGIVSYAVFFATFLYLAGFIGNLFVPVTLDGTPRVGLLEGLLTNLGLIALFAVQHSVMARPAFKRWLTRFIPAAAERSTYVLASSVALIAMVALWEPLGGVVWQIDNPAGRAIAWSVFAAGWLLVLVATFLINHFDLFGLRQVWLHLRGKPYTALRFATPWLYRQVRHPLYVGWLMAFWATPTMTLTHLAFALALTAYILVAIRYEERDLIAEHGESYRRYRERVPMLVPRLGTAGTGDALAAR